jgi:hypothetical protein
MTPPAAARRMLNLSLANTRTAIYPRRREPEGRRPSLLFTGSSLPYIHEIRASYFLHGLRRRARQKAGRLRLLGFTAARRPGGGEEVGSGKTERKSTHGRASRISSCTRREPS